MCKRISTTFYKSSEVVPSEVLKKLKVLIHISTSAPFSIPVVYAWCRGPDRKWGCRGHISHFARAPGHISHSASLLPIRAHHWGAAAKNPSPCLPLPHHASHPLGRGEGIKSTISACSLCNGDLPQSEARKSAHECTVAGRRAIN